MEKRLCLYEQLYSLSGFLQGVRERTTHKYTAPRAKNWYLFLFFEVYKISPVIFYHVVFIFCILTSLRVICHNTHTLILSV